MKLIWRDDARREAIAIRRAIELDSPHAARRWAKRLDERVALLSRFPYSGRVVPEFDESDLRELIFGNYRLWYLVIDDRIEVARIWHARMLAPDRVREMPVEYRLSFNA